MMSSLDRVPGSQGDLKLGPVKNKISEKWELPASPYKNDEFLESNRSLIITLQAENKTLRKELSSKEGELHKMTIELENVLKEGGNVSEQFLIGSLKSARESISSLDVANQDLLDALTARQEEIMRLSTAGISLQNRHRIDLEKIDSLEAAANKGGQDNDNDTFRTMKKDLEKAQSELRKLTVECNVLKGQIEKSQTVL